MAGKLDVDTLRSWRKLYRAALTETDVQKLPLRIEEARRALILRSRELFSTSPITTARARRLTMLCTQ
jgi:hypothetical protein